MVLISAVEVVSLFYCIIVHAIHKQQEVLLMAMVLQCCATSARKEGTLPETALMWGRSTARVPRSACAVAKANVQQQEWRTTTGNAVAKHAKGCTTGMALPSTAPLQNGESVHVRG